MGQLNSQRLSNNKPWPFVPLAESVIVPHCKKLSLGVNVIKQVEGSSKDPGYLKMSQALPSFVSVPGPSHKGLIEEFGPSF